MFSEGKTDLALGGAVLQRHRHAQTHDLRRVQGEGLLHRTRQPARKKTPALRWFAEDREKDTPDWGPRLNARSGGKGLQTTSGKIEFVSTSLKSFETGFRRPVPPGHAQVCARPGKGTTLRACQEVPPRHAVPAPEVSRFHTMGDGKDSCMNDMKDHRVLIDGHYYRIIRINNEMRTPGTSRTATWSAPSMIAARSSSAPKSPSGAARHRAHLRVLRGLRSDRQTRRVRGPQRLHEHPFASPLYDEELLWYGA